MGENTRQARYSQRQSYASENGAIAGYSRLRRGIHKSVIRGRRPRIGTISVQMADVIARIYSCRYPRGSTGLADTELRVLRRRMTRTGYRAARICGDGCVGRETARTCFGHLWCRFVCLFGGDDKNDDGQPMVHINYSENQYFRNS